MITMSGDSNKHRILSPQRNIATAPSSEVVRKLDHLWDCPSCRNEKERHLLAKRYGVERNYRRAIKDRQNLIDFPQLHEIVVACEPNRSTINQVMASIVDLVSYADTGDEFSIGLIKSNTGVVLRVLGRYFNDSRFKLYGLEDDKKMVEIARFRQKHEQKRNPNSLVSRVNHILFCERKGHFNERVDVMFLAEPFKMTYDDDEDAEVISGILPWVKDKGFIVFPSLTNNTIRLSGKLAKDALYFSNTSFLSGADVSGLYLHTYRKGYSMRKISFNMLISPDEITTEDIVVTYMAFCESIGVKNGNIAIGYINDFALEDFKEQGYFGFSRSYCPWFYLISGEADKVTIYLEASMPIERVKSYIELNANFIAEYFGSRIKNLETQKEDDF